MEADEEFDLEMKLEQLSIDPTMKTADGPVDHNMDDRDQQLARLIARVTADLDDSSDAETDNRNGVKESDDGELPSSLIVTNLPKILFYEQPLKTEFEMLFRTFDETAQFHYLKSFRRARVDFPSPEIAAKARVHLHHTPVGDCVMNCFFGHPPIMKNSSRFLELPPPVRQFLISPPASPPVDWAPGPEVEPVVNFDLLAAIASLGPGEEHELLPQSENQPGIVVHICEDGGGGNRNRIQQTRCPNRI